MKIFDKYLFQNLVIATFFIAIILAFIVFLTQSLRFLDMVINAGSTGNTFWMLTLLALPRFFEVILPLSIMAATFFIYNKMMMDSEVTAIRAMGYSPISLAKPAIVLGAITTILLWVMTFWVAPNSMASMQKLRMELTAEFSNVLFREGIFNQVGKGLTVYIKERTPDGELAGLMIHDTRDENAPPSTILAKRGLIVVNENNQQVVVFDGSRQEFDPNKNILQKLAFDRYTIDLPDSGPVRQRWAEPDERNIFQLLYPNLNDPKDIENLREFSVELHRRFTGPLLAFAFPLIALCTLLLGPMDRRGQNKRIGLGLIVIILIQGLFLTAYNLARNSNAGIIFMYILTIVPIIIPAFALSETSEHLRRQLLYKKMKMWAT